MLWIALAALAAPAQEPVTTGAITGRVHDHRSRPVADAFVVLCQASSGLPLASKTRLPFGQAPEGGHPDLLDWWSAKTDAAGSFTFSDVPAGEYRLVAQSFPDAPDLKGPLDKAGLAVHLRGVAEGVRVPGEPVLIEPLGDATFVYHRGAGNDDWYLLLSRGAQTADPVLGPLGWKGAFCRQAIGWCRMNDGQALVRGLPGGRTYWGIFANDSNPGFGGGSVHLRGGHLKAVDTNLVASWSDGQHDPPERLEALTQEVAALVVSRGHDAVEAVLTRGREEAWRKLEIRQGYEGLFDMVRVLGPLEREVVLDSGTRATVADLMAAAGYASLRR